MAGGWIDAGAGGTTEMRLADAGPFTSDIELDEGICDIDGIDASDGGGTLGRFAFPNDSKKRTRTRTASSGASIPVRPMSGIEVT